MSNVKGCPFYVWAKKKVRLANLALSANLTSEEQAYNNYFILSASTTPAKIPSVGNFFATSPIIFLALESSASPM